MIEKSSQVPLPIIVASRPFHCKKQVTELSLILPIPQLPAAQHLTVEPKVQARAVQVLAVVQPQALDLQAALHQELAERVPTHEEYQSNTIHSNKHINL